MIYLNLLNFYSSMETYYDLLLILASISLLGLSTLPILFSGKKVLGDIVKTGFGTAAGVLGIRGLDSLIDTYGGGTPTPAAPTPAAPTPAAPTPAAPTPAAPTPAAPSAPSAPSSSTS